MWDNRWCGIETIYAEEVFQRVFCRAYVLLCHSGNITVASTLTLSLCFKWLLLYIATKHLILFFLWLPFSFEAGPLQTDIFILTIGLIISPTIFCHACLLATVHSARVQSLNWLPVSYRIDFKVLLLVCKSLNGLGSEYMNGMLALLTVLCDCDSLNATVKNSILITLCVIMKFKDHKYWSDSGCTLMIVCLDYILQHNQMEIMILSIIWWPVSLEPFVHLVYITSVLLAAGAWTCAQSSDRSVSSRQSQEETCGSTPQHQPRNSAFPMEGCAT